MRYTTILHFNYLKLKVSPGGTKPAIPAIREAGRLQVQSQPK